MKLAISSIGWRPEEEPAVADVMAELGVAGVEIAPTKAFARPLEATAAEVSAYRRRWENRGIRIVAMQALLFGRPDLVVFGEESKREETARHLEGMIRLAARCGAGVLVFGSPKNRQVGALTGEQVDRIAVPFFGRLGDAARKEGVRFCIEPNPAAYGCDFIRTAAEGLALVGRVANPGFGLHLDAGGMTMNSETDPETLRAAVPSACHFHASEPNLATVGAGDAAHPTFASALRDLGYPHWISIEMRDVSPGDNAARARGALRFVIDTYGLS